MIGSDSSGVVVLEVLKVWVFFCNRKQGVRYGARLYLAKKNNISADIQKPTAKVSVFGRAAYYWTCEEGILEWA